MLAAGMLCVLCLALSFRDAYPHCHRAVQALLAAGVPCVAPEYVVDWVAHPWSSLAQHYIFE